LFGFFKRKIPDAACVWHKVQRVWPVRLIDGRWYVPTPFVWRRWNGRTWEYREHIITDEEWLDRQG
jgi:hypothetical protein